MARLAFAVNADLARVVILPDVLAVFIAIYFGNLLYYRRKL